MKLRTLSAALVLAAVTAAPASAMISKQDLSASLTAAATNGNVSGVINGDTVTLFGVVEGAYDASQVKKAALSIEGVNNVVSRLVTSR